MLFMCTACTLPNAHPSTRFVLCAALAAGQCVSSREGRCSVCRGVSKLWSELAGMLLMTAAHVHSLCRQAWQPYLSSLDNVAEPLRHWLKVFKQVGHAHMGSSVIFLQCTCSIISLAVLHSSASSVYSSVKLLCFAHLIIPDY